MIQVRKISEATIMDLIVNGICHALFSHFLYPASYGALWYMCTCSCTVLLLRPNRHRNVFRDQNITFKPKKIDLKVRYFFQFQSHFEFQHPCMVFWYAKVRTPNQTPTYTALITDLGI